MGFKSLFPPRTSLSHSIFFFVSSFFQCSKNPKSDTDAQVELNFEASESAFYLVFFLGGGGGREGMND